MPCCFAFQLFEVADETADSGARHYDFVALLLLRWPASAEGAPRPFFGRSQSYGPRYGYESGKPKAKHATVSERIVTPDCKSWSEER